MSPASSCGLPHRQRGAPRRATPSSSAMPGSHADGVVGGVDAPAGEDPHAAGERERRVTSQHQGLDATRAVAQQHDGRGRDRDLGGRGRRREPSAITAHRPYRGRPRCDRRHILGRIFACVRRHSAAPRGRLLLERHERAVRRSTGADTTGAGADGGLDRPDPSPPARGGGSGSGGRRGPSRRSPSSSPLSPSSVTWSRRGPDARSGTSAGSSCHRCSRSPSCWSS